MESIVKFGTIFNAIAATATKALAQTGDLGEAYRARSIFLEINGGSTPNWTLAIQGKVSPDATYHNIDFMRVDQGTDHAVTASTLTVNWSTAQHYVIPNPPPFVQLVATRTGGTLTVFGAFSSEPYADAFPTVTLGAGSAIIGQVSIDQTTPGTTNQVNSSPNIFTIKTTVTRPADANAYTAGDAFSSSASAPTVGGGTFTSAARASGGTGKITDAIIGYSTPTVPVQGEIWVFDQAPTAINDNAAFSISDADLLNVVGIIPFNTTDTTALNELSYVQGLDIRYTCVGTANLRFLVKILTAYTPAASDVLSILIHGEN